jgi:hypothetical protein
MKGSIIKKKSKKNNDKVHMKAISRALNAKKVAYNTGRKIARKWIKCASSQEIMDVLPRINSHHDINYFATMRNFYFISIEKKYPNDTKSFKNFNNIDFMKGWREEVLLIWRNNKHGIIN